MSKLKLVVLSGAGISAESGLKTFRDSNGLWEGYNVEEVATPEAWKKNKQLVLDFYNQRRKNVQEAMPNKAHVLLAELEKDFDVFIVTQNIDDLHERAGSSNVIHLHGEILKKRSSKNEDIKAPVHSDMMMGDLAPDGSPWRPDIVWFGEAVPLISHAAALIRKADLFVITGTSLMVYPAAGLISYVKSGTPVFVVDKKIPAMEYSSNLVGIEKPATEGLEELKNLLIRKYI